VKRDKAAVKRAFSVELGNCTSAFPLDATRSRTRESSFVGHLDLVGGKQLLNSHY
jgi:hypothetical protein